MNSVDKPNIRYFISFPSRALKFGLAYPGAAQVFPSLLLRLMYECVNVVTSRNMALLSNRDVHDYNTRNRDHLIIYYNINKKLKYSTVSTPKIAKLIESGGSKNMYTTRLSKAEKEKKL